MLWIPSEFRFLWVDIVFRLRVCSKAQLWVTSEVEERGVPRGGKGGSRTGFTGSDCPDRPCVLP